MSIPKTKARKAFPGDTAVILLQPAVDSFGREWSKGEVFQPRASGYDNSKCCKYVEFGQQGCRFESQ